MKKILLLGLSIYCLVGGAAFAAVSDKAFLKLCENADDSQAIMSAIKGKANMKARDRDGLTPLMLYVTGGNENLDVLKFVMQIDPNVNVRATPSTKAKVVAVFNQDEIVRVIEPHCRTGSGIQTP